MRNRYEISEFNKRFALAGVLIILAVGIIVGFAMDKGLMLSLLMMGIVLVVCVIFYIISYLSLRKIIKDVDNVAELMDNVRDGGEDYLSEEFRQGSIGVLYTNFYKMVNVLQESKGKEAKEKEFLRDIISDISHQLKTPLASLNVFMDLLYEDRLDDDVKKKKVLEESKNQLSRMEWMVLSMLKLARIEAGSINFEISPSSVKLILNTAFDSVNYLVEKRNQKLTVKYEVIGNYVESDFEDADANNIMLNCDGEWLTEAIINILKNASDYSKEESEIQVNVEDSRLYTRITITDNGIGIPEEALPNIFKRFYRVNNEVNPNSVGIGLSLSKSIVEGMGGRIAVRSEVGKYTSFILTFVKD